MHISLTLTRKKKSKFCSLTKSKSEKMKRNFESRLDPTFLPWGYVRSLSKNSNVSIDRFCQVISLYCDGGIKMNPIFLVDSCYATSNKINESILCNYHVTHNNYTLYDAHRGSTTIFKPFISQLLSAKIKQRAMMRYNDNNYNDTNNNDDRDNCNKSGSDVLISMHVRIKDLGCNHHFFENKGYNLQCGVIAIPKVAIDVDTQEKMNHNQFLVEIEKVFDKDKFYIGEEISIWLEDIMTKNEKFKTFGAHYTYHYYWHFERDYKCTIGKDNDSDDMILYRNRENIFNEKYCLSENDCMTVCIDSNNCLHFVHSRPMKMKMKMKSNENGNSINEKNNEDNKAEPDNNNTKLNENDTQENVDDLGKYLKILKNETTQVTILGEKSDKEKEKEKEKAKDKDKDKDKNSHHSVQLDFDNYDYLFAISSARCGCDVEQFKGFKFQLFWQ